MSKIKKYSLMSTFFSLSTFIYAITAKAQDGYTRIVYGVIPPSRIEIAWIIAKLLGIVITIVIAPIAGISWYISRKKHRRWLDSMIWSVVYLIILVMIIIIILLINKRI